MRCPNCQGRGQIRGIDDTYECDVCRGMREITPERHAQWLATEAVYEQQIDERYEKVANHWRPYKQLAFDLTP